MNLPENLLEIFSQEWQCLGFEQDAITAILKNLEQEVSSSHSNLLLYFDTLTSTNQFAKSLPPQILSDRISLILTDNQSDGHGRLNRSWYSDNKSSLTFTLCIPFNSDSHLTILPLIVALAQAKCFSKYIDKADIDIKWPNDILIKNQKCSGTLIESQVGSEKSFYFIGIGINVTETNFPSELQGQATFLEKHYSNIPHKYVILKEIIDEIAQLIALSQQGKQQEIITEYEEQSSYSRGKKVSYLEGDTSKEGTTDGLDSSGALWCLDSDNKRQLLTISEINTIRTSDD